jgi:hypothetical protein
MTIRVGRDRLPGGGSDYPGVLGGISPLTIFALCLTLKGISPNELLPNPSRWIEIKLECCEFEPLLV